MFFRLTQRVLFKRVQARFKRGIIQRIATEDSDITSLSFGFNIPETIFQRGVSYSKLIVVEMQHERDQLIQGHLFQERNLYHVQNVVLDAHSGVLFNESGKIIEESSSWPVMNLLLNAIPKPPKKSHLPRVQHPQVIAISSNGFYHWLIEDLAPFLFASKVLPDATILVSENAPLYVRSFVEKYFTKIEFVPRFVSLNQYSFVSKGPNTEWVHPQDISILRDFFTSSIKQTIFGRKIYIPRTNSSRSPDFEAALIVQLREAGWEILETQGLSLNDQIEAISSAEVICGVHGAGLSGMIWMAPNSTVIELGPRSFVPCFSRLGMICKHQYHRIPYEENEDLGLNGVFDSIISLSASTS
jgi:hypothetical protein